jgi:type IV pilus assembly protein PilM
MDEQSIWKKEISFRRKPKEKKPPAEPGEEPTSIWKKEISFRRKPKKSAPEYEVAAETPGPASSEQVQVSDTGTSPEQPVWQRAVSFTPAAPAEAKAADTPADESGPAATETAADGSDHVRVSDTGPGPEETSWKKEVSFSRKPEERRAEEPVTDERRAEEPVSEEPVSEEPVSEEPVGEEAVAEEPPAEEPVAEEPPAEEPVAEEPPAEEPVAETPAAEAPATEAPAAEEPVAEEPVAEEPAAQEPVAEELVAEEPAAEEPKSWSAKPAASPAPAASGDETWYARPAGRLAEPSPQPAAPTPAPAAEAPTVVHPPVPKAELPPLPDEKVPFWKKEISFGGKKGDKAPREKQPRQPKIKVDRGSRGSKRLVGLKIGASQLAAARVANNGSAELLQVAREPLATGIVVGGELRDADALAAALKDFFTKHKLPKRGVRLGIANNRIGVRTFEIAGIEDEKQLANAIRFRAQEALPIPIEEAVLDYQILGEGVDDEGQPTRRILLVVAYRELIDRYVEACRKAGIVLAGIDLEAFALLRALHAPQDGVGDDSSAALVAVAVGHERSTFAVSDGRVCEFTRVLEWGGSALNVAIARVLDAAPSEVEDVKHELTLTDSTLPDGLTAEQATKAVEAMRKAVQTFARELVSSLQYYQNQPGSLGIGEIVLTGGTAHLPGLAAELEGLIGVRVRVGDPLARMKVSKRVGDPERVGSLAVAIGLGIED